MVKTIQATPLRGERLAIENQFGEKTGGLEKQFGKGLAVAIVLALASYSASAECEWSNPGADKYMLSLPVAVDKLDYIPEATRTALKKRLTNTREYDDHITMSSTSVVGSLGAWSISDMNGGNGKVCKGLVTTKTWKPDHTERALVFCEKGWCLAYFSVCRNIALATLVYSKKPENFLGKANMPDPIDYDLTFDASLDWTWKPVYAEVPSGSSSEFYSSYSRYSWPAYTWQTLPVYSGLTTVSLAASQPVGIPEIIVPVTPIPEPSTLLMLAGGILLLAFKFRK
jgi:hypothetical protein